MNLPIEMEAATASPEKLALAQRAFEQFHTRCFWFMRENAQITAEDIPYIPATAGGRGTRGFFFGGPNMPIASFEKTVLRLLAANRNPESFVAGATVLLRDENSHRRSQDIDLFHDTAESVKAAAEADCALLGKNGYQIRLDIVEPTFRRALIARDGLTTKLEWVFDSAFRFFPVEPDVEWGYMLNFWDAATNKVLALAGRGELRDYLDVLHLHRRHLSLGALTWAACGKDIGYTPQFLIEEAQRLAHSPASLLATLNLH